ncbi:MAG: SIS domain-containing protein [Planctomycetes bacterium]|nr:SIS domain-containing protein [Planctomycetota bacterium]
MQGDVGTAGRCTLTPGPSPGGRGEVSRREFVKASAVAATAGALLGAPLVHAAGSDTIRVGLIGCGGRGSGAASQALGADPGVVLVAMGTSLHAAMAGRHYIEAIAGIPAEVDNASEFRYRDTLIGPETLVIFSGSFGPGAKSRPGTAGSSGITASSPPVKSAGLPTSTR